MRAACVRRGVWVLACFLACCLAPVARTVAVVGGSIPPATDHRFDAVALLFTDQPWAPCGGWISGTCTLIAPDTVLLARHSVQDSQRRLPATGARTHKVRFRRGVDGTVNGHFGTGPEVDCVGGGYQEIYIHEFIGNPSAGIDLVLGRLEYAPVRIEPMPLHVTHNVHSGEPVTLVGWGFDGNCLGQGEAWTMRMKTGVLPPLRFNVWCCFDYNNATIAAGSCFTVPAGTNWVIGNLHDSGAPLLSPDPADPLRLRLFGVVTGVNGAQKVSAWNEAGGIPVLADVQPRPMCLEDLNGDGEIDIGDLLMFIQAFLSGQPLGDIDGIPGITMNDLFTYILRFLGGC